MPIYGITALTKLHACVTKTTALLRLWTFTAFANANGLHVQATTCETAAQVRTHVRPQAQSQVEDKAQVENKAQIKGKAATREKVVYFYSSNTHKP